MTDEENEQVIEYVTATVGGQLFGLPISRVQDVFMPDRLARVPLAPRRSRASSICAGASSPLSTCANALGSKRSPRARRAWPSASNARANPMAF